MPSISEFVTEKLKLEYATHATNLEMMKNDHDSCSSNAWRHAEEYAIHKQMVTLLCAAEIVKKKLGIRKLPRSRQRLFKARGINW